MAFGAARMRGLLAYAVLGSASAVWGGPIAKAADLVVLSGGPMKPAFAAIVPGFEATSKVSVDARYEAMTPLLALLAGGSPADVVIVSAEAMVTARSKGWIDEQTITEVGRVGVGVGVRQGAARPDISTAEAVKSTLLAAKSVAATDPTKGTSGTHFAEVLTRLGITDKMKPKLRLVDGGFGAELVLKGEVEMVVQPMTVIIPVVGVTFVGPLPGGLQKIAVYLGAATKTAKNAAAAKAFLDALTTPSARATFAKQGFEK